MTTEQEALRLAQSLSMCIGEGLGDEAAAMLRKLVAEREADRAAMREALEALEAVCGDICATVHHGPKDRHAYGDLCPVHVRHVNAANNLRQRLEGTT